MDPHTPFRPGRYLTFRLARQDYAIDASRVRGVVPLPGHFRGQHVPLVDLVAALGLPPAQPGRSACVIVVESGASLMGLPADHVSGILHFRERDLARPTVRVHGRAKRLLDLDQLQSSLLLKPALRRGGRPRLSEITL